MQVAKLSAGGALNVLKSGEGNDSLDTFIHQAMGKESVLSFSRTGDSPVQWIHLLNSFDQPDLPGWPLFTPMKIQLQKCEKCSAEFCSLINYRRHMRMHRRRSRSLIVDKESHKNRDLLGAFWDNLSLEDAKNVVSFDDVSLKEVSGSTVVKELASSLRKPGGWGVWMMPQTYVKAGSILLDKHSRLPISSQDLFMILDDASERTFLCAGTAESVQKFIIDGEAEEALEMRNLVASASLLFEQKLVRAWLADKDAEALRCQKLLVEEEEAAEKRRSQLLERRKQKQLRQQEQKAREQSICGRMDAIVDSADSFTDSVDGPSVAEISVSQVSFDNNQDTLVDLKSFLKPAQISNEDIVEARFNFSSDHVNDNSVQNVESRMEMENGHSQVMINGWQVPKSRSQRSGRNGFYGSHNLQAFKLEPFQKQGLQKDRHVVNSGKVWTRKSQVAINDESSEINLQNIETSNMGKSNSELMIGSISIPVRSTIEEKYVTQGASNTCSMDSASSKDNDSEKYATQGASNTCSMESASSKDNDSEKYATQGASNTCSMDSASSKDDDSRKYATQGASNTCSMDSSSSKEHDSPKEILESNSTQDEIDQATDRLISMGPAERSDLPVQSSDQASEETVASRKVEDDSGVTIETCLQSFPTNKDNCGKISQLERNYQPQGMPFSSDTAKAFLAQRWKLAISGDHVKLVLSREAPGNSDGRNDTSLRGVPSSGIHKHRDLGDAETQLAGIEASIAPIDQKTKAMFKRKPKERPR